ncbi:S9 family peptidase [Marinihelvus fidelis]|uniref:S9 family peptidase n=1 Tax=Marinihelvus fidelis TaxID=2613842 RepID=A0A5N0T9J6_9GAMM|nr:S9 family peptidase [Marinihelvus fidelis]
MSRTLASLLALTLGSLPVINHAMDTSTVNTDDPYLWLEDIEGEKALDWARAQNEKSLAELEARPEFQPLFEKNLAVYDSQDRYPSPSIRGEHIYNFWRDAEHERGLWRRTTFDEYRKAEPAWEILIDLDALAEAEGENWVWAGSSCLQPGYERCLVSLSRGGADASVTREFDLPSKTFVDDGFQLPEAKGFASFMDRDTVMVSTDFGPGSMTESGYPRIAKLWRRGTPLEQAEVIHEGQASDIGVWAYQVHTPERVYPMVQVAPTFFSQKTYLFGDDGLKAIPIPADANIETIFRNQLLVSLKSDWTRDGKTWSQGALVSIDLDDLLAGEGTVQPVVLPDARSAIDGVARIRDRVLVNRMTDVRSRLTEHRLVDGQWKERDVDAPTMGQINIVSTSDDSNHWFFSYTDFLTPTSLFEAGTAEAPVRLKELPAFFNADPFEVSQHFTRSADGTRVPYFMVARKDLDLNASNPTLIWAYGGFEVSQTPNYSATIGMDWLEQGGVYVVANIRGGGEYGPAWHQAAQRENRQKSYDDFYAVAEDLIARKVTSPAHLGIRGGSGGGLLVGMLFTQRPELFNAVVCQVPLLDMWRFDKLLAGASWVEEYGDPDNPDDWAWLQNYSPYHNLDADKDYPRVFFTTSTRDDRVHPAHARKMVAKMNDMGLPNLYYENIEGGHGGAANNRQSARVQALIYTYLLHELR